MFFKASVIAALVAAASALQVTSPAQGSSWDLSKDNTVQWASVSTDPPSFSIQLVNMAVNPSVTINIADNVQTSAGSYKMSAVSGVNPGQDYQINLVSKQPNDSGLLAQSAQFTVTSAGASTTSASFSSSTPGTSSASSSSGSSTMSTTTTTGSSGSTSSSSSASGSSGSSSSTGSSTSSGATASKTGNAAASLHFASGAAGLGFVGAVVALFA